MARSDRIRIGNRVVEASNLDKVFYPRAGFTKGDVIDYYAAASAVLVPHLRDRAMTLKRYPNGVEGKFFYEKECPRHAPGWIRTVGIPRKRDGKRVNYCLLGSKSALVWAANIANLELHVSLDKRTDLDRPTAMVFDLDPGPGTDILECGEVALRLKDLFAGMELDCLAKTSGSKGIQLYVPLNTRVTYADTNPFSKAVAQRLEDETPDEVTSNIRKDARKGRVLIDWSQNNQHKTTVAVYSLRAKEQPWVSAPVTWAELRRAVRRDDADALFFEADEVLDRIERHGDLFEPVLSTRQKLPPPDALAD